MRRNGSSSSPGVSQVVCPRTDPSRRLHSTPGRLLPRWIGCWTKPRAVRSTCAKRANAMLALTGRPFWQPESYDHLVRDAREFEKIQNYIEQNPVRAGLVREASEYRWSSAGWATRGSPADRGLGPTIPTLPPLLCHTHAVEIAETARENRIKDLGGDEETLHHFNALSVSSRQSESLFAKTAASSTQGKMLTLAQSIWIASNTKS